MTQIWQEDRVIPVTKIQAGPCLVTQVKTEEKDGYNAVQIGFDQRKEKNIKKPQKGHLKDFSSKPRYMREFRLSQEEVSGLEKGSKIEVNTFEAGDKVDATSVSKGRGFQGVVKRHGFAGAIRTHGTKDQERMPGSAGAMGPGRIFKGKKMPGRMGGDTVTVKNLEVVDIDTENNVLLIKGAVAGPNKSLVLIKGDGELKFSAAEKLGSGDEKKEEELEKGSSQAGEEKPGEQEAKDKAEEKTEESAPDTGETEDVKKEELKEEAKKEEGKTKDVENKQ